MPFHLLAKVPANLTDFQKQVKQIIQSHHLNSTDPTPALKTLYTLTFGNGGKNKNIISQYLYIRNINPPFFWRMGNSHIFDVSTDNENEIVVIPKNKTKKCHFIHRRCVFKRFAIINRFNAIIRCRTNGENLLLTSSPSRFKA